MNTQAYGLDFGTSNSAISIMNNDRQSYLLSLDGGGSSLVRSVLFFPEGSQECFIGDEAIQRYLASGMRGRFISSFKSMLPLPSFSGTNIHGTWFSPEALVGAFLSALKKRADTIVGTTVRSVVLGRPVEFSKYQAEEQLAVERLTQAARIAGFDHVRFQLEPIAAALHYETQLVRTETVLVVDVGGGTTDFTIMRLSQEQQHGRNRSDDVLSSGGVYIGGDTFSGRIMRTSLTKYFGSGVTYRGMSEKLLPMPAYIMETLCDWKKIPYLKDYRIQKDLEEIRWSALERKPIDRLLELIHRNLGFSLFEAVERSKRGLSDHERETIQFQQASISISEPITRDEYENMIYRDCDLIKRCAQDVLRASGLKANDVTTLFLTGGTSKTPLIQRMFSEILPNATIVADDPFTSVALGLAQCIPD